MNTLAGLVLTVALLPGVPDIGKISKLKKEAEKAYLSGDYKKAIEAYSYLADSMGVTEEALLLNLGHAHFKKGDSTKAFDRYQQLINASDKVLKSEALNQMGLISHKPKDLTTALNFFKEAVKTNTANEEARFNYQLLKRQIDQDKEQNQNEQKNQEDQQKKDQNQEKKNQQNQQQKNEQQKDNKEQDNKEEQNDKKEEQQNKNQEQQQDKQKQEDSQKQEEQQQQKEQQQKEEQADPEKANEEKQPPQMNPEKLKEMNISMEKAKMIMEAMKNSEIQYIQQNKRKATKKPDSGKPDW